MADGTDLAILAASERTRLGLNPPYRESLVPRTTILLIAALLTMTAFPAEAIPPEPPVRPGTNVAFGAKVTASHEVDEWLSLTALTDGRPYSLVHPRDPNLGKAFYFLIDLGNIYAFDHLSLRQRNDRWDIDRMSRIHVEVFDRDPGTGISPSWTAIDRADGSYPEAAEVDILHAADGSGTFRGRYLRISSDSPVPKSPQLAEVEAYETRTPRLLRVLGDGREVATSLPLVIPPRTKRLHLEFEVPQPGSPGDPACRWRLLGHFDEWQTAGTLSLDTICPPAGDYHFEVQAAHSDGTWDGTKLAIPLKVRPPFTQTLAFRWLVAGVALLFGAQLTRSFTRRRIAALEAQTALAEERTRIARDMHDEVGARLAQLAVLQDVFAREHQLPDTAKASLRQLSSVARQAVASLDEVVWTVDPRNDSLASTAEHLAQHTEEYLAPLRISCRFNVPIEWPAVELRAQVRHELILALKEALQNVVKHAAATEVVLTLRCEEGWFVVTLTDDGRGFSPSENQVSDHDGLRNMSARLESVGGRFDVRSPTGDGTTVELRVRLPS